MNFNKVPGVKKLTAPEPDAKEAAFRKKYCAESKAERPRPRADTPLTSLIWDGECGAGLTECSAGFDAAKGSLPAAYEELFSDLLDGGKTEAGNPDFAYHSCDITMAVEPYILGMEGLGLMHAAKHQSILTDFALQHGDASFNDSSTQRTLVRSIFLTGKSQPAEVALRSLLDVHPKADMYKPEVLRYLAAWESDVALDYCTDTLQSGNGPKEACIWYFGERRHAKAYPLIVRRMEDEKEAAARALGHLGNEEAVPILEKTMATANEALRTASLVALMNLGKDDLFPQFELRLQGRRFLPSGAEVKEPDVAMIEAATLEAIELEDDALRSRAFEVVEALGELDDASSKGWRVPVFSRAARASLGDAEAARELAALLDDPRKDVRHLAISYMGANFERLRGLRVPDRSLLEPLARAYEMEPAPHIKTAIIWAAAYLGAE